VKRNMRKAMKNNSLSVFNKQRNSV